MLTIKYKVIFYDCNMKLLRFNIDFDIFKEAEDYIKAKDDKFKKYGGVFYFEFFCII